MRSATQHLESRTNDALSIYLPLSFQFSQSTSKQMGRSTATRVLGESHHWFRVPEDGPAGF